MDGTGPGARTRAEARLVTADRPGAARVAAAAHLDEHANERSVERARVRALPRRQVQPGLQSGEVGRQPSQHRRLTEAVRTQERVRGGRSTCGSQAQRVWRVDGSAEAPSHQDREQ